MRSHGTEQRRKQWRGMGQNREVPASETMSHLRTISVSKWFKDQSRSGAVGGSYHSPMARWPCSSWVLPTFLPVPRDQNSTFNILWPASFSLRSKGNFCPSCKRETKRQLNAASAFLGLPGGIKGTPLKGFLRETHLYQGLVLAPRLLRTQWLLQNTCATWSKRREQTMQPTDSSLERPQGLRSRKKKSIWFIGILAKITLNPSILSHKFFNFKFKSSISLKILQISLKNLEILKSKSSFHIWPVLKQTNNTKVICSRPPDRSVAVLGLSPSCFFLNEPMAIHRWGPGETATCHTQDCWQSPGLLPSVPELYQPDFITKHDSCASNWPKDRGRGG